MSVNAWRKVGGRSRWRKSCRKVGGTSAGTRRKMAAAGHFRQSATPYRGVEDLAERAAAPAYALSNARARPCHVTDRLDLPAPLADPARATATSPPAGGCHA